MIIHIVRFKSLLPDERIAELFQVPASEYLAVPDCCRSTICASEPASTVGCTSGTPQLRWSSSWRAA
jgi:hypothetical protein